jgi:outer membrane protein assembly factor BamB
MHCHDIRHTGQSPYSTANTTGVEKWRFKVNDSGWVGSPVIGGNGMIYFGTNHYLYSVSSEGIMQWRFDIGFRTIETAPAIDKNGIIYVGTTMGDEEGDFFYAIAPNGTLKWSRTSAEILSSPAIGDDGIIYFSERDGYITALFSNGTVQWRALPGGIIACSPAVDNERDILYCGSIDGALYALNSQNGTVQWMFQTGGKIVGNPSIDNDGTVYVRSYDGYLYALCPNNGTIIWKLNLGYGSNSNPSIAKDGTIYTDNIYGLCAVSHNGSVMWEYQFGNYSYNDLSCPAISDDGTIYFGIAYRYRYGELLALNSNGTKKWGVVLRRPLWFSSSPAIAEDGTIYYSSNDEKEIHYNSYQSVGFLHAFGPGEIKQLSIEEPQLGMLYYHNQPKRETQSGRTICIGDILVNVSVNLPEDVEKVRFILKSENPFIMSASLEQWVTYNVTEPPYQWYIDTSSILKFRLCPYTLRVTAYYKGGCEWTEAREILFVNLKLLWRFFPT